MIGAVMAPEAVVIVCTKPITNYTISRNMSNGFSTYSSIEIWQFLAASGIYIYIIAKFKALI